MYTAKCRKCRLGRRGFELIHFARSNDPQLRCKSRVLCALLCTDLTTICFKNLLWRGGCIKHTPNPSFFDCFDWPIIFWFSAPCSGASHHAQSPTNIFKRHQPGAGPTVFLPFYSGFVAVDSMGVCDPLPAFLCFWAAASAAVKITNVFT